MMEALNYKVTQLILVVSNFEGPQRIFLDKLP